MAETKPTASSVKATSVQAKKSSNAISWIAPIFCIVAGYVIWRFILGDPSGFATKGEGWFWPDTKVLKMPYTVFTKVVSSFHCYWNVTDGDSIFN